MCQTSYDMCLYTSGRESYLAEDWRHTRYWMLEGIKKSMADEEQAKDVDMVDMYDHLAFAEYKVIMSLHDSTCVYVEFNHTDAHACVCMHTDTHTHTYIIT